MIFQYRKISRLLFVFPLAAVGACLSACGPKEASQPAAVSSRSMSAEAVYEVSSISGIAMEYIPGGTFTMGSAEGNPDEAPPHPVTVTSFLMDRTPVTHAMFTAVQRPDPSNWQANPNGPVERVRWRDAKIYCNERSRLEKLKPCYDEKTTEWTCDYLADGYRLPTEAEWEYAARAGSDGSYDFAPLDSLRQYSWFAENSDKKTHPVGQKRANRWGLYDMYGNVSVWCEDVYDPAYYAKSSPADPHGPESSGRDVKRVLRGGNWKVSAEMCSATRRQGERTGDTDACFATDYCGLRCVRRATQNELAELRNSKKKG